MNKKVEVYVSFYKDYYIHKSEIFKPFFVGSAIKKNNLDIPGDNTGDNISKKNLTFNELTLTYWAWKNSMQDYIGFGHYRRYFVYGKISLLRRIFLKITKKRFKKEKKMEVIRKIKEFEKEVVKEIDNFDIILPKPIIMSRTLKEQYGDEHYIEHYEKMGEVINELFPQMYKSFLQASNKNTFYIANMFIFKRDIFEDYCNFVFKVLFKLEEILEVPNDKYQSRIFGYLAERLLIIYIEHITSEKNYRIKYLDVMNTDYEMGLFDDDEQKEEVIKNVKKNNKKTYGFIERSVELNNSLFLLKGWGIVLKEESYNFKVFVKLYNSHNEKLYKTRKELRRDISFYFKNIDKEQRYIDYNDSGFNFIINTKNLNIGNYKIKMYLYDKKDKMISTFYFIDKYIEISHNKKLVLKDVK